MMKKVMITLAGILLTAFLITGCGSSNVEKGKLSLTLATPGTPEDIKLYKKIIGLFEKKHPDVRIVLQVTPYKQLMQKIQTQMAGGTPPDIMFMLATTFPAMVRKGVFASLQEFVEKDKDFNLDDYFPIAVKPYIYQGNFYGVYFNMDIGVLAYNKGLFDEAGLTYPDENWTWDDFLKVAKKLTKDTNGDGRIDQFGEYIGWFWPVLWANGGSLLNKDQTECMINSPKAVEAIQWLADLALKYHVTPLPTEQTFSMRQLFAMGKIAMAVDGYTPLVMLPKKKGMEWDIAPMPKGKEGKRVTFVNTAAYVVSSQSKHKKEAWEFIKCASGDEAMEYLVKNTDELINRKSFANSPLFLNSPRPPRSRRVVIEATKYARYPLLNPHFDEMNVIIYRELEKAWLGLSTAQEATDQIKKEIDRLLESKIN